MDKIKGTERIINPTQADKEATLGRLNSPYALGNGNDVDQEVADARVRHTETLLPKELSTSDKYGNRPLGAIVRTLTPR
ncbi:MAG: hypothetical protein EOM37_07010 [Proteobacteria bacterium]|jgi:hypothetical protein|nr:hypothetical protein [Alphaproteobacteria bacterium]NCC03778.1 hypothetical protein [Pseudomonadota bacterium]